jgi:hypothetical protein
MPWLKQLATGLLPQKPGFMPMSVHVGIVVDKVELGEAFVLVLWVFSVYIVISSQVLFTMEVYYTESSIHNS